MNNVKYQKHLKMLLILSVYFTPILVLYDDKTMAQGVTKVFIDKNYRFGA